MYNRRKRLTKQKGNGKGMYFTHTKDGRTLTAALHGEIDHHSAKTARTQLDLLIEREIGRASCRERV